MFEKIKQNISARKILRAYDTGDTLEIRKALANAVQRDGALIIPEGVEYLPMFSLTLNQEIQYLVLPSTMREIQELAFFDCSNLKSAMLNDGLEYIGGYAFAGVALKHVDIPETVKEIGEGVFSNCAELSSITLNSPETKIDKFSCSKAVEIVKTYRKELEQEMQ